MPLLRRTWPPVAAWLAGTAVIAGTAAAKGYGPLHPVTWARWDSYHYLNIAKYGYFFGRCKPPSDPHLYCGDAGWFPAYPWLLHALTWIGLPLMQTAAAVAWLFSLGTVLLVWRYLGSRLGPGIPVAVLFAAFAPGRVYDYAIFPLSMLVCFVLLHLLALQRGRFGLAAAAGFVAAQSYAPAIVLAVTSPAWVLAFGPGDRRRRVRLAGLLAGAVLAADGLVVLAMWLETGYRNAYTLTQHQIGLYAQEPFAPVMHALRAEWRAPLATIYAPELQTLLVTVALLAVAVVVARRREPLDWLVFSYAVAIELFASSFGSLSLYRTQAALLPLAVLLPRLPRPVALILLAVAVYVSVPLTELFLSRRLI